MKIDDSLSFIGHDDVVRTKTVDMLCSDGSYIVTPATPEPAHKSGVRARRRRVVVKNSRAVSFVED
jgi:hypothetical protein